MKKVITVAVCGAPNCGKSTFSNSISNGAGCIVSSKPNTTRDVTLALHNSSEAQIIFVDTPGISCKRTKDDIKLTNIAKKQFNSSDMVLFIFDGSKSIPGYLIEVANAISVPKIVLINKTDLVSKGRLLPKIDYLKNYFHKIFMGSALLNEYPSLLEYLISQGKESEPIFPEDTNYIRDFSEILKDKTKEAIFEIFNDEIPYNVKVENDQINEGDVLEVSQKIIIPLKYRHIFLGLIQKLKKKAQFHIKQSLQRKVKLSIFIKTIKTNNIN